MSVILQHLINISMQEIDNWHGQVWTNKKPNNDIITKRRTLSCPYVLRANKTRRVWHHRSSELKLCNIKKGLGLFVEL